MVESYKKGIGVCASLLGEEAKGDMMSKSQTGFGNTAGSMGGLPSSSLKGKLATLEVYS